MHLGTVYTYSSRYIDVQQHLNLVDNSLFGSVSTVPLYTCSSVESTDMCVSELGEHVSAQLWFCKVNLF